MSKIKDWIRIKVEISPAKRNYARRGSSLVC